MSAPTYTIHSITTDSLKITVSNPSGYYLRIVFRRADSTTAAIDQWVGNSTTYNGTIAQLDPDTDYVVNVGYNETGEGGATFVGAKTVTTEADPEPEVGGSVYIYIAGTGWTAHTPYIYVAGTGWTAYAPYIYISGTGWVPYS